MTTGSKSWYNYELGDCLTGVPEGHPSSDGECVRIGEPGRARRYGPKLATAVGAIVPIVTVVVTPVGRAYAYSSCGYPNVNNAFADQVTSHEYKGMYGWYYSNLPSLPNYTDDFSDSHLYLSAGSATGSSFIEVGDYKGSGYTHDAPAFSGGYFYTAYGSSTDPYDEIDFGEVPQSTYVDYEIQYTGYNDSDGEWKFAAYGNSSLLATWGTPSQSAGVALAGGEIGHESGTGYFPGTEMLTTAEPDFQLLDTSGNWNNWTPSYMSSVGDSVTTCNDPGFTFSYSSDYMQFSATGTEP